MQQFQWFYWVTVYIRKYVNSNKLGPNLWISHEWAGPQPWVGLVGHRPTHLWARTSQSEWVFPHKRTILQTRSTPQFQLSGWLVWSQTIPQVTKPNVEVLGWCGYMWFAVVRPVGHTAKFSKMTLGSYFSSWNMGPTLSMLRLYFCSVYMQGFYSVESDISGYGTAAGQPKCNITGV